MSQRTAIITGGSRGIGQAVAVELGSRHYRTGLLARDQAGLEDTATLVESAGGASPQIDVVDVTEPRALATALENVLATLGNRIDLLVNNAGSALRRARLEDLQDSDWQDALDLNFLAAVQAQRACFEALRATGGCVINISSVVADRASVGGGPYVAAKAALASLTRTTALEWARYGVRCIAVAPGYVDTEFNRAMVEAGLTESLLKRVPTRDAVTAAEVARLVADLAEPIHRHVTGVVIPIDGGLTIPI